MTDVVDRAIKVTRANETDPPNKALGRLGFDLSGKILELLTEVVPTIRTIAVLKNSANAAHDSLLQDVERAARACRVQLQVFTVRCRWIAGVWPQLVGTDSQSSNVRRSHLQGCASLGLAR
jgi:hypothetical protein